MVPLARVFKQRKTKAKPLQIWNGRDHACRGRYYVAAHSRADAARLLAAAEFKLTNFTTPTAWHTKRTVGSYTRELAKYFSEGCWGNDMAHVPVERGVWHQPAHGVKPVRVV